MEVKGGGKVYTYLGGAVEQEVGNPLDNRGRNIERNEFGSLTIECLMDANLESVEGIVLLKACYGPEDLVLRIHSRWEPSLMERYKIVVVEVSV